MSARSLELAGKGHAGDGRSGLGGNLVELGGCDRQGKAPRPSITEGVSDRARRLVGPCHQGRQGQNLARGRDPQIRRAGRLGVRDSSACAGDIELTGETFASSGRGRVRGELSELGGYDSQGKAPGPCGTGAVCHGARSVVGPCRQRGRGRDLARGRDCQMERAGRLGVGDSPGRTGDLELTGEGFAGRGRRRGRSYLEELARGDCQRKAPGPGITGGVFHRARGVVGPCRQRGRGRDLARGRDCQMGRAGQLGVGDSPGRTGELELTGEGFAGRGRRRGRSYLGELVRSDCQGEAPCPNVTEAVSGTSSGLVGPCHQPGRGRNHAGGRDFQLRRAGRLGVSDSAMSA